MIPAPSRRAGRGACQGLVRQVCDWVEEIVLFSCFSLDYKKLCPHFFIWLTHSPLCHRPGWRTGLPVWGAASSPFPRGPRVRAGGVGRARPRLAPPQPLPLTLLRAQTLITWPEAWLRVTQRNCRSNEPQQCHSAFAKGLLKAINENPSHKPKTRDCHRLLIFFLLFG